MDRGEVKTGSTELESNAAPGAGNGRRRSRRRPALLRLLRMRRAKKPGSVAGIELEELATLPSTTAPVGVTVFDYAPDQVQVTRVDDVDAFIGEHRPPWAPCAGST